MSVYSLRARKFHKNVGVLGDQTVIGSRGSRDRVRAVTAHAQSVNLYGRRTRNSMAGVQSIGLYFANQFVGD